MSLRGIAKETRAFLDAGGFVTPEGVAVNFQPELSAAIEGTRLFTPEELERRLAESPAGTPAGGSPPRIDVTGETTQVAAHRLAHSEGIEDLVLLNFASARNAGGGFLSGAKAQEEDLTRCSGLYPCLLTQPAYYQANRVQKSLLYTDHVIYSPAVPWFRTRSTNLLDHVFLASVITAPAPNAGEVLRRDGGAAWRIENCLRRRAGMVLTVARELGHRNLLLGAWGCGVFRNDPALVADAFGAHLEATAFAGCFDAVTFGVLDRTRSGATLQAFRDRFPALGPAAPANGFTGGG